MMVLSAGMALGWSKLFGGYANGAPKDIVLGIHIVSWILQFIGHGVFESTFHLIKERKPALFDSLTQVLNAPLFVIVEILEMIGIKSS